MAIRLARPDPPSAKLVAEQIAEQARARHLASIGRFQTAQATGGPLQRSAGLAGQVQARQQTLAREANSHARSQSSSAITLVIGTGIAALAGALALIVALVHSMRRPLDALVDATKGLAAGELERRVRPSGPRELRDLGDAFNAMGEDLSSANHRIEEERRRLAVTIESLGDALLVTKPGTSKIATANPRAADLLPELRPGDRIGSPQSPLPPLRVALEKETVIEHDGRILAVTAAPLGEEGDGVVWTVRDVTERARLERAKSEFVATASHELRSPLTSIKGFVELLERSPENMTERQREFIHIVLRSTDRLVELVNDLLDVARIEADSVEIVRRPIDIGEAVRDSVELMGPRISGKHQTLGVNVAPGPAAGVRRSGPDPSDHPQPADQRTHVHRGGRPHPDQRRGRPGMGQDRGRRLRHGHDRGGARAHLRSLLPGPRSRRNGSRHRPRALDRQVAGGSARRQYRSAKRAGPGNDIQRLHPRGGRRPGEDVTRADPGAQGAGRR